MVTASQENPAPEQILRLPDVSAKVKLSRSQIYNLIKEGSFPAQVALSTRCSGWLQSEIDQWIADRVAASRGDAL